jgi:Double zinc ribbon/Adenylate and Guanylate cyclase catalytic domain
MRCPRCQQNNREEARFCAGCGSALAAQCPACGHQPPPGAAFCDHCGTRLACSVPTSTALPLAPQPPIPHAYTPKHLAEKILTSRSVLEGERRQVTVLLADLAGFTSLAEQRDPGEVHTPIDGCFARITAEVHRFEGTVNQYTGDGVMALFGRQLPMRLARGGRCMRLWGCNAPCATIARRCKPGTV